jgi:uncharacterized protein (TIGR02186 family)
MMRRCALSFIAIVVALAAAMGSAAAERLVISISRHQVMVTSSFTGTSIVLFGTVEPDTPTARRRFSSYDIVVTITGPQQTVVTRRKERVLGIWANTASRNFVNAPTYLAVLANRPFEQITNAETRRRLQLGLDSIVLPQEIGDDIADVVRDDPFRANYIRIKKDQRLYVERPNGLTFITPTVFRAEIPLPAIAPVGNYDADVKLFGDGALVSRQHSAFELVKVGFEQFVASAAHQYGLLYGLATVIMALLTGWIASVVFRRD